MSRRGVYRGIYSVLQNDLDFRKLSPPARHTLLSMRLADYVGIACFWRYDLGIISAQTGYPIPDLEAIFAELEAGRWVLRDGEYMWIRNGLRHDPTLLLGNPNHKKGVLRAIEGLPRIPLLKRFCRYYGLPYPFASHPGTNGDAIGDQSDKVPRSPSPNPNPSQKSESESSRTVALATESDEEHQRRKQEALAAIEMLKAKYPSRQQP